MENELVVIPEKAIAVYQCDKIESLISDIEKEARSIVPDLTTDKGRKSIASLARKVSTSKVTLDGMGKDLVSDWKDKSKAVDAERRIVRDRLDALRDEIRKPLTDWEEAEKEAARIKLETDKREADYLLAIAENDLIDRQREIERKEAEQLAREIEEREKREAKELEEREKREAKELEEREKQAAIDAENARLEREARIAQEAKEEAERKAKQDALDAQKKADAAILAAQEAEKEREREAIRAVERARIAEENAAKAAEDARIAEVERVAEIERLAKAAQDKLEADKKHVSSIRTEAKQDLMKYTDEATAKKIVLAISKGSISNITINY